MTKSTVIFLLSAILIAGFSLRFYGLNRYDFSYDEAFLLIIKDIDFKTFALKWSVYSPTPPLFVGVIKLWTFLFQDPSFLRGLPLIGGVLSISSIYLVARELFDKKVGLISALLLAISPFHIYYSQELRGYTFIVFVTLMAIYFFLRAVKENKISLWGCYVIFSIFSVYSHNFAILILLCQNIYLFLCGDKKLFGRLISCQCVSALFYVPWALIIWHQLADGGMATTFFWVPKPSLEVIMHTFNIFNLGYSGTKEIYWVGMTVFFPLFLYGILKGVRVGLRLLFLLSWLFLPLILVAIVSLIMFKESSIYLYRAFIFITPAYYILIANGIKNIKYGMVSFVFIIILSTCVLSEYYFNHIPLPVEPYHPGVFEKKEIKSAADYISKEYEVGDVVAHTSRATIPSFIFYHNNKLDEKWVVSDRNPDWLAWSGKIPVGLSSRLLGSFIGEDIQKLSHGRKRIWLVFSGWGALNGRESPDIRDWLDQNMIRLEKKRFRGIDLYLYKCDNLLKDNLS